MQTKTQPTTSVPSHVPTPPTPKGLALPDWVKTAPKVRVDHEGAATPTEIHEDVAYTLARFTNYPAAHLVRAIDGGRARGGYGDWFAVEFAALNGIGWDVARFYNVEGPAHNWQLASPDVIWYAETLEDHIKRTRELLEGLEWLADHLAACKAL